MRPAKGSGRSIHILYRSMSGRSARPSPQECRQARTIGFSANATDCIAMIAMTMRDLRKFRLMDMMAAYSHQLGTNPADLNFDGCVDGADLGQLIGAWGCP